MLDFRAILDSLFSQDYSLARLVIQRGIAVLYLIAFIATLDQFKALLGENGLLPVPRFLKYVKYEESPSIFHFFYSDTFLTVVAWTGLVISVVLLLGLVDNLPWWSAAILWAILWVLYLSIVNVGQTFYSFGWESMLLEMGFLVIFLGANKNMVPILIIFLFRWMLFRVEFGAGMIKLRGDECWRNLTCLDYHHETQPMPNPLSWYFHNLPSWIHRFEVAANFFFQLVLPWGLFLPQPFAAGSAGLIILSQLWLVLSGNFSWLNWMTILLGFSALPNSILQKIIPISLGAAFVSSGSHQVISIIIALALISFSYWPIKNLLSPNQAMNASFNRYHIINTYGAFGSVTKKRHEIIIEGTSDTEITEDSKWLEYEFKGKPGDISKRPPQFAPYHLRLDWLMWFASFGQNQQQHWFIPFVEKLLKNDKETLRLIKYNPFPESPPEYIRARFYHYQFTTPSEHKESKNWWKRELVSEYLLPARLR